MSGDADDVVGRMPYDETILRNPEMIDGTRILLHAERPSVTRTQVRGRLAYVTRRAVTTRKTFEVDVKHEELVVEYETGDGGPTFGEEPERIVVLLHAEQVEIVKTVRVVEEVRVSKRVDTTTERLDLDLRREIVAAIE